ncbi:MAG: recombination mediator RecR [Bacteroidales bacterium]|jgi:recombination protein RecR|nr:recombination mediator RecR [Bacteroidales bacterium]
MDHFSSKYLEQAVEAFASLPGIGKRTALRLALHLLDRDLPDVERFAETFVELKRNIFYCACCNNLSDKEICSICGNPARDHSTICLVESIRDVMAVENTHSYNGVYHVLGGIISPIEGIGPDQLSIDLLMERLQSGKIKELIFALPATVEGDTTGFYLFRQIEPLGIPISIIARGIAVGDNLEYTDEISLSRSILQRRPYSGTNS